MSGTTRTYRFPARDRTGWLLGLQATQCVILGGGVLVAGVLLNIGAPAPVILLVVVVAGIAAFAPVGGRAGYSWLPVLFGWLVARRGRAGTWTAAIPRFTLGGGAVSEQPKWPRFLRGIELHEDEGWRPRTTMAVVVDRDSGNVTGMLRVTGREFALIDRSEQERLLAGWGDTLAAFCKERSPVTAVRWFEWSAPADALAHLRWSRDHIGPAADPAIVDGYLDMVASAGPLSTRHETIVTVTVRGPRRGLGSSSKRERNRMPVETLRDELRLLADRLGATGLSVDTPLSTPDVIEVIRAYAERTRPR